MDRLSWDDIELLWDRPALLTFVGAVVVIASSQRHASPQLVVPFVILFVPALLGNLASILVLWRTTTTTGRPIKRMTASIVVSLVGWLVFVPLASWLTAPLLVLETSVQPLREALVLLAYLVLGESWFYAVHRLLHASTPLFQWFHAHHHRITDPHVVNASYQHPVELIAITMGTAWVGPLLVEGHWLTVSAWCAAVMILGNYGHSGARSIHDEHHRTSRGNYGFFVIDRILGTVRAPVVGARQRARARAMLAR